MDQDMNRDGPTDGVYPIAYTGVVNGDEVGLWEELRGTDRQWSWQDEAVSSRGVR
jgi:hypothetical protein